MNSSARSTARTMLVALRTMVVLTLVLGLGYTLVVTGLGRVIAPHAAAGSLVTDEDGVVIGSALIGQSFTDADGNPLPQFFQSRPSAAGYDGGASSGSNLGPENPDLIAVIEERRAAVAALEGVDPALVPPDALTASASGLDPAISPAYARLQVPRVAAARKLPVEQVARVVEDHITGRTLAYLGEPGVNVLELNLALEELESP